jgi:hypothetical protein
LLDLHGVLEQIGDCAGQLLDDISAIAEQPEIAEAAWATAGDLLAWAAHLAELRDALLKAG